VQDRRHDPDGTSRPLQMSSRRVFIRLLDSLLSFLLVFHRMDRRSAPTTGEVSHIAKRAESRGAADETKLIERDYKSVENEVYCSAYTTQLHDERCLLIANILHSTTILSPVHTTTDGVTIQTWLDIDFSSEHRTVKR